jgi:hypothetical protein
MNIAVTNVAKLSKKWSAFLRRIVLQLAPNVALPIHARKFPRLHRWEIFLQALAVRAAVVVARRVVLAERDNPMPAVGRF